MLAWTGPVSLLAGEMPSFLRVVPEPFATGSKDLFSKEPRAPFIGRLDPFSKEGSKMSERVGPSKQTEDGSGVTGGEAEPRTVPT